MSQGNSIELDAEPRSRRHPSRVHERAARGAGLTKPVFRSDGPSPVPHVPASAHDFDFLHGCWVVGNRRRTESLADAGPWAAFETVHTCRPLLNGLGVLAEIEAEDGERLGMLHVLDRDADRWLIHVLSADGTMQPPLRGRFHAGVGEFVGRWPFRGGSVLVRHTWTPAAENPQWAQSFSQDGGRTWQTNWTMAFARVHWPA
ncbi:MAG TPA: hypothetical protein VF329_15440 [Gammaproteobacteria bacterium]